MDLGERGDAALAERGVKIVTGHVGAAERALAHLAGDDEHHGLSTKHLARGENRTRAALIALCVIRSATTAVIPWT